MQRDADRVTELCRGISRLRRESIAWRAGVSHDTVLGYLSRTRDTRPEIAAKIERVMRERRIEMRI